MKTTSIVGSRYFLTFIDDLSRYIWVYFLKEKSQAFSKFKEFKVAAENQSEAKIKVLRTDRGGEFESKEFRMFVTDQGIQRQLTTSYTPQQNGVAEWNNRTIVEMARSMLKAKNLKDSLWAKAVHTAVYLLNRCPMKAVSKKTPEEAWTGQKPSVQHLRVFGCIAYSHIPDEKRMKLDAKSRKCLFIGYSTESKGY
jgi:transposase InsO family protein